MPTSTSTAPFLFDGTTRALAVAAVDSPVADILVFCAVMLRDDEACTFNHLSLLGMQTASPTVDQIMTRVVVTHPWMGVRMRELLQLMPPEVLLLMRGITGVVISSEVRPSFYWARTGAIYLDAEDLWLTEAERAVITTVPDPRLDDIRQFRFLMLWRYVQDDRDIRSLPRSLSSLRLRIAALLYHELAHANDFFPPSRLDSQIRTIALYQNIRTILLPSTGLASTLPLQSTMMESLAQAAFFGVRPTATQLALTAADIAGEFPLDHANDYYNYATDREDLAMAFEEAMMLLTLGVSRDVAVVDNPADATVCNALTVAWGQRTRIGEAAVGARSIYVVDRILPEVAPAVTALVEGLPPPRAMVPGLGWCANIGLGAAAARSLNQEEVQPVQDHAVALIPYL